jgi:hypothetical protein
VPRSLQAPAPGSFDPPPPAGLPRPNGSSRLGAANGTTHANGGDRPPGLCNDFKLGKCSRSECKFSHGDAPPNPPSGKKPREQIRVSEGPPPPPGGGGMGPMAVQRRGAVHVRESS